MELLKKTELFPSLFWRLSDISGGLEASSLPEFCSLLVKLRYDPWHYTIMHAALDHACPAEIDPMHLVSQTNKNRRVKLHRDSFSWILDLVIKERSWPLFACFFIYSPEELSIDLCKQRNFTVVDRAAELGYWNKVESLLRWDGYKGLIMYLMRFNVMRHTDPVSALSVSSTALHISIDADSKNKDEKCSGLAHIAVLDDQLHILGIFVGRANFLNPALSCSFHLFRSVHEVLHA
jgi:hypothetical protein